MCARESITSPYNHVTLDAVPACVTHGHRCNRHSRETRVEEGVAERQVGGLLTRETGQGQEAGGGGASGDKQDG